MLAQAVRERSSLTGFTPLEINKNLETRNGNASMNRITAKRFLSLTGFTREPESHACKGVDEWLSVQDSAPRRNPVKEEATAVKPWNFTILLIK